VSCVRISYGVADKYFQRIRLEITKVTYNYTISRQFSVNT